MGVSRRGKRRGLARDAAPSGSGRRFLIHLVDSSYEVGFLLSGERTQLADRSVNDIRVRGTPGAVDFLPPTFNVLALSVEVTPVVCNPRFVVVPTFPPPYNSPSV